MVSRMVQETVHTTDDVAADVERLQIALGEGPCVDAFSSAGPALACDLHLDEYAARWPAFTPAALALGAQAVFALPLQLGATRLGALDLYRARPGPLTPEHLADALVYADTAGMLLLDGAAAPAGTPRSSRGNTTTRRLGMRWCTRPRACSSSSSV